jgi:hypothetical protein
VGAQRVALESRSGSRKTCTYHLCTDRNATACRSGRPALRVGLRHFHCQSITDFGVGMIIPHLYTVPQSILYQVVYLCSCPAGAPVQAQVQVLPVGGPGRSQSNAAQPRPTHTPANTHGPTDRQGTSTSGHTRTSHENNTEHEVAKLNGPGAARAAFRSHEKGLLGLLAGAVYSELVDR